jgi:hypothetical protein
MPKLVAASFKVTAKDGGQVGGPRLQTGPSCDGEPQCVPPRCIGKLPSRGWNVASSASSAFGNSRVLMSELIGNQVHPVWFIASCDAYV